MPTLIKTPETSSLLDGFTFDEIESMLEQNLYLRSYIKGYLAEFRLQKFLSDIPGVTSVTKIPDEASRKGDFEVIYRGLTFVYECKSVILGSVKDSKDGKSWSARVKVQNSTCRYVDVEGVQKRITNLPKGTFDILAISTYEVDGKWNFLFMENRHLPESLPGYLSTGFVLDLSKTKGVVKNPAEIMELSLK